MPRRRIFVSYHSPDRGTAKRLATALRAHDLEVFLDTWTLQPGAFWTPALAEGLADADAVLLLGRNSPGPWQTLEYYEALDRKARQPDFPVVPVVLGDTQPRLPFLGQLHWLQLADPAAEPALARLLLALRGEPLSPVAEPWRVLNPYRGLLALTEADADYFFGRDTLTADILDRLHRGERCLMLVGNSGVGKSSLVQAGVIAALRRQRWPGDPGRPWPPDLRDSRSWLFLTMRPGDQPLYELARAFVGQWTEPTDPARGALARSWEDSLGGGLGLRELLRATTDQLAERSGGAPPRRFVLVVDQAEELYTRADAAQARRFSASLAEAAQQPGVLVLASLRADHYGRLQEDTPLYRAAVRIDVPPLREEGRCEEERCDNGLCAVIGAPARVLGARFEHDTMVLRLAAATAGEPGALPLLSYLLEDMWAEMQKRGDGVLRWADYARLGELRSVLSRRAEAYRERCAAEQRRTLMRLFTLRLAHVPAEGEVVHRRAHRGECSAAEWAMAEELAGPDWRLLVIGDGAGRPAAAGTGQPTAEVAHEVLLRRWERLAGWLTEQRGFPWNGRAGSSRTAKPGSRAAAATAICCASGRSTGRSTGRPGAATTCLATTAPSSGRA